MPSLRVSLGCGRIESSVLCRTQAWREGEDAVVAVAAGRSRVSESRTRGEAGAGTGGGIGKAAPAQSATGPVAAQPE